MLRIPKQVQVATLRREEGFQYNVLFVSQSLSYVEVRKEEGVVMQALKDFGVANMKYDPLEMSTLKSMATLFRLESC